MADQPVGSGRHLGVAGRVGVTLAATLLLTIAVTAVGGALSSETPVATTSTTTTSTNTTASSTTTTTAWDADSVYKGLENCANGGVRKATWSVFNSVSNVSVARIKLSPSTDNLLKGLCGFEFCVADGKSAELDALKDPTDLQFEVRDGSVKLAETKTGKTETDKAVTVSKEMLTYCPIAGAEQSPPTVSDAPQPSGTGDDVLDPDNESGSSDGTSKPASNTAPPKVSNPTAPTQAPKK